MRVYAAYSAPTVGAFGSHQMPELPEIETVRRQLANTILGANILRARLLRRDVLRDPSGQRSGGSRHASWLLEGNQITSILRKGKQLYIEGSSGQGLLVRLGMSGRIALEDNKKPLPRAHRHATWWIEGSCGSSIVMHFIDPRRFGGLFVLRDQKDLQARFWSRLGPDALTVKANELSKNLKRTQRVIKIALLDQAVLAGVGNIYADEALHAACLSPHRPANTLDDAETTRLAKWIRNRLKAACRKGGTTFRDYRDPGGEEGGFASQLKVYGRKNQQCCSCKTPLRTDLVAARTTVWCEQCQG